MKKLICPLILLTSLTFCNSRDIFRNSEKYKDFFPNEKNLQFQSYMEEIPSSGSIISGDNNFYENQMVVFDLKKNRLIYLIDYKNETSAYKKEIKDDSLELILFYDFNLEKYIPFRKDDKLDRNTEELFKKWDTLYNKIRKLIPEKEKSDEIIMELEESSNKKRHET